jgi:hypothetical protein
MIEQYSQTAGKTEAVSGSRKFAAGTPCLVVAHFENNPALRVPENSGCRGLNNTILMSGS